MKTVDVHIRSKVMNELDSYDDNTAVIVIHNAKDKDWYDDEPENAKFFFFNDEVPIKKGFLSQILTAFIKEEPQAIMSDEDAREMLSFIKKNIGKDFIVACEYGRGRSVAVARFMEDNFGYDLINLPEDMDGRNEVSNGNSWVYYQLKKALKKNK